MGDVAAAYAGCRQRIAELVVPLDEAALLTPVPACPAWTVHDVVAHLAGVVTDALAGRVDKTVSEEWTAAQVSARRGVAIADVLEEWNSNAVVFEQALDHIGRAGVQAVADAVTHEQDLRAALGVPGARDVDAILLAVEFLAPALVKSASRHGVALRVEATNGAAFGPDEPDVRLRAEPFELVRAATGRRTTQQLLALDWTGDASRALPAFTFGPFRPTDVVVERVLDPA